jgi:chemotaxis protein CheD
MSEGRTVAVGIGELFATREMSLVLAAYGLGSCIALSAYDPAIKAAGLAHIMLPDSSEVSYSGLGHKFANVAVPALIKELVKLGAKPSRLICKVAGGAQMLASPAQVNGFRIGERNVGAVKEALRAHGIVPQAADTGGSQGRTIRVFVDTGLVVVRTVGKGDIEL